MLKRLLFVVLLSVLGSVHASEQALFRYGGEVFTPDDLSSRMSQLYGALMLEQHKALQTLIDEIVFDVYVEREAKRQGKPLREVGMALLAVVEPSEDEVALFYQQNQARIAHPFDQIKEQLRAALKRERILEKRAAILKRIKKEGDFELMSRGPASITYGLDTRGRPFKGNPEAPITIVEFSDYQCPNCKRAASLMDKMLAEHPDMVKVYYMDFPINRSGISRVIAHGGVCAAAQGRFWQYHDLAFERQERLQKSTPAQLALELELDKPRFNACMQDSSTHAKVEASYQQARRLGITDTPTVFVDNRPFVTNHFIRDISEYIARKKAEAAG